MFVENAAGHLGCRFAECLGGARDFDFHAVASLFEGFPGSGVGLAAEPVACLVEPAFQGFLGGLLGFLPYAGNLVFPSLLEVAQPPDQSLGLVPCGLDLLGESVERALGEPA